MEAKQQIFDCFTFFNEKELLELRFMEYYDVVDYFVIVEATKTHTGKAHTPIFNSLKVNLKKYLDKVIHVIVDDLPDYDSKNIWIAENFQRNAIERGLQGIAKEGDAIFVSDLDEFWNKDKLNECLNAKYPIVFEQDLFYYYVNCQQNCKWLGTCYAPYGLMSPQEMRNYARFNNSKKRVIIKNGGWHYSYMGGAMRIREKIENIAESEQIIDKVGDIEKIQKNLKNGLDLWSRQEEYAKKRFILLDSYKPKSLDQFLEKYPEYIAVKPNVEIISLIYCSNEYLKLISEELEKIIYSNPDYIVGIRIIANDASPKVLKKLKESDIPYTIYNDPNPNEYYINRVYRCYNNAVKQSRYDNVCLINSDMIFANNWLKNLMAHHNGENIPTSRLIESGKMPSGQYGISQDCGRNAMNINYKKFNKLANSLMEKDKGVIKEGGLFMPVVFNSKRFIDAGGYPEGNLYQDGTIGTQNGAVIKSGDDYFFNEVLAKKFNMKHITVFDSICYHIQEGERDMSTEVKLNKIKNLILNNIFSKKKNGNKRILTILGLKITYKKKTYQKNGIKGLPSEISTWKHNPCINNDAYKILSNLHNIKNIVDFGCGDGFWGKLSKYIFPNCFIEGVELERSYIINNKLDEIYDKIYNNDIIDMCDKLSGDLLICSDVLEHLSEEDCLKVIKTIKKHYRYIMINGPLGFQEQQHDIPSEIHRCGLRKDMFANLDIISYKSYQNDTMFSLLAKGEK